MTASGTSGARWRLVEIAAASLLIAGCGGPNLTTAPVKGKVTVAGQPLENIQITFIPAEGRPALGRTDAEGNFTLSTMSANDGAVPGTHQVKFFYATDTGEVDSSAPPPESVPLPFNAKYAGKMSSGITAEVEVGKTNEFTWDLEK
jgi:hypothetical protein